MCGAACPEKWQKPNLSSNMSLTDSVWLMWCLDLGGGRGDYRRSMKQEHLLNDERGLRRDAPRARESPRPKVPSANPNFKVGPFLSFRGVLCLFLSLFRWSTPLIKKSGDFQV